ncbi:MAG: 1-acyl-sn-glycerol-3-phosphate acyltransferase [Mizugakiibacter sp.]|uniref:1-acyl-sn-glycerol-3-phosphate acyltransferase n=1 Tax=Mizugakiibacter sp. TaxID=1972610 RepID=UPI0032108951
MSAYPPRPSQLPPQMPTLPDNWRRALCRWLLRRAGWRLVGTFPDCPKVVLIGAPHTSWWDGIWGLLLKVAIGADVRFMAKKELFLGPLGWLLGALGGIPIERRATHGLVEQMVERFRHSDRLWLGITPEGTRKKVPKWKSGFWHIARGAGVPVLPVYFHYPDKVIGIGPPLALSGDVDADIARLRAFYAPYRGKYRGID